MNDVAHSMQLLVPLRIRFAGGSSDISSLEVSDRGERDRPAVAGEGPEGGRGTDEIYK